VGWWISPSSSTSAGVGDCTQHTAFDRGIDKIVQKSNCVLHTHGMEDRFKPVMDMLSVARGRVIKFNMVDDWR